MIREGFAMSLKTLLKVITVLDPQLDPEMDMAALIQQTTEKNRFLRGVPQQNENACNRIRGLADDGAQSKRTLLVSLRNRNSAIALLKLAGSLFFGRRSHVRPYSLSA